MEGCHSLPHIRRLHIPGDIPVFYLLLPDNIQLSCPFNQANTDLNAGHVTERF